jgi:hypothetical protein
MLLQQSSTDLLLWLYLMLLYILNHIFIGEEMMRSHKEYQDLSEPVDLLIHTKSPDKWLLIDRETGDVYQGNSGGFWDRLDPVKRDIK